MLRTSKRLCKVQELVGDSDRLDELVGIGGSHLLVRDQMNPGYFLRKPLYDYSDRKAGGKFVCDVHE